MTSAPSPQALLGAIARFIRPLEPPVFAFARQSRKSPFHTLIAVLLSSRTQDRTTAAAQKRLFSRAKSPREMLGLGEKAIAALIYPVGFYRQKAAHIVRLCRQLLASPEFPHNYDSLIALPGVGRKTANLVLALAFSSPTVAVDTHVFRISRRLGWAREKTKEGVEEELKKRFPRRMWSRVNQVLVGFGQTVCRPVRPRCGQCVACPHCPFPQSKRKIKP